MSWIEDENIRTRTPFPIQFRLGLNTVNAVAEIPRNTWRHVIRATIPRPRWRQVIESFVRYLPSFSQSFVRKYWPGWFLPPTVYIKTLKPDWDDEFEQEKDAYIRMAPLQGRRIPVLYGEARVQGIRALVLSEVVGVVACEQPKPRLTLNEFEKLLEPALRDLAGYGFSPQDAKPANVIIDGNRLVFVDLESAYHLESYYKQHDYDRILDWDKEVNIGLQRFGQWYQQYLDGADYSN